MTHAGVAERTMARVIGLPGGGRKPEVFQLGVGVASVGVPRISSALKLLISKSRRAPKILSCFAVGDLRPSMGPMGRRDHPHWGGEKLKDFVDFTPRPGEECLFERALVNCRARWACAAYRP